MRIVHRLVPGLLAGSLLLGGASGVFAAKAKANHFAVATGQVQSINGTSVLVTLNPGAVAKKGAAAKQITVTLSATVKERGVAGGTGGLVANDYAAFVGIRSATTFTANRVIYSTKPAAVHRAALRARALHTLTVLSIHQVRGTYQGLNGTALSIQTKAGKTLSFQIATTTRYFVNGQLVTAAPTFTAGQSLLVRFKTDKTTKTRTAVAIRVKA